MPFIKLKYELILASKSKARAETLRSTKIPFKQVAANVNETTILNSNKWNKPVIQVRNLAIAKTLNISEEYPESLVIGADQMVLFEGKLLGKPGSFKNTVLQLIELQSKEHQLLTGWAIGYQNKILASGTDFVLMKMRPMTSELLTKYVQSEESYDSCGGYYFESSGKLLFEKVIGSHDSLLGLPLEPILNAMWDLDLFIT
tara:strand:- start:3238 stop:3840 length:603 start_codon:yes stop_codon:yes gene_type:complete